MKAKQKAHQQADQNFTRGANEAMEEAKINFQGTEITSEEGKEGENEAPQISCPKETEKEGENSNVKRNESPTEDEEPEQQGLVIYEGPWTKEEQFHYDIMFDEAEWKNKRNEPDTAKLVAEMLGTDSFDMEIEE